MDRPGILDKSAQDPTSYLSVGRDITARKLAERQLAESERRLTLALEAGRQGVWELRLPNRWNRGRPRPGRAAAAAVRRIRRSISSGPRRPIIRMTGNGYGRPSSGGAWREANSYRSRPGVDLGDGDWSGCSISGAWPSGTGRGGRCGWSGLRSTSTSANRPSCIAGQRATVAVGAGGRDLGVWEYDLDSDRIHYDAICLARLGWAGERSEFVAARLRAGSCSRTGRTISPGYSPARGVAVSPRRDGSSTGCAAVRAAMPGLRTTPRLPSAAPTVAAAAGRGLGRHYRPQGSGDATGSFALHDPLRACRTGVPFGKALEQAMAPAADWCRWRYWRSTGRLQGDQRSPWSPGRRCRLDEIAAGCADNPPQRPGRAGSVATNSRCSPAELGPAPVIRFARRLGTVLRTPIVCRIRCRG